METEGRRPLLERQQSAHTTTTVSRLPRPSGLSLMHAPAPGWSLPSHCRPSGRSCRRPCTLWTPWSPAHPRRRACRGAAALALPCWQPTAAARQQPTRGQRHRLPPQALLLLLATLAATPLSFDFSAQLLLSRSPYFCLPADVKTIPAQPPRLHNPSCRFVAARAGQGSTASLPNLSNDATRCHIHSTPTPTALSACWEGSCYSVVDWPTTSELLQLLGAAAAGAHALAANLRCGKARAFFAAFSVVALVCGRKGAGQRQGRQQQGE